MINKNNINNKNNNNNNNSKIKNVLILNIYELININSYVLLNLFLVNLASKVCANLFIFATQLIVAPIYQMLLLPI